MHFSCICLAFFPLVAYGYNVHLYDDAFWDGRVHRVVSDECEDIPMKMKDEISSLNTHGTCIFIYKKRGCSGDWAVIAPGTYGHSNLKDISFDDIVRSIGPCKDLS
ncbi:hypothetical protein PRIPAC_84408 [Pristionchus pacificus]|uniref:Beta/gamma crystallin 'Greek key' domain-containing protein n=1 Tax=Pristionchus pacificus TaxID=54126 RepID=A0A2A6BT80_PRIPA|nr:hypothetical protein PRIPAC_84408 [Pristionchus pacificus]|eukprot:PDM69016.1 hypothetical protein PRIPAC_47318 [Pristionchus pacificus]